MEQRIIETLGRIREKYGHLISESAERWKHRPEVLAGIMMRETWGGESKWLDVPGPGGRGDHGHGHGLMQIDDRSFLEFCKSENWKDPAKNIEFGAHVLAQKRVYLSQKKSVTGMDFDLERASIAAYNCGEGNVWKSIKAGEPIDSRTTGKDYSKAVLEYAEAYRDLDI